jgi:hypothetical protein
MTTIYKEFNAELDHIVRLKDRKEELEYWMERSQASLKREYKAVKAGIAFHTEKAEHIRKKMSS